MRNSMAATMLLAAAFVTHASVTTPVPPPPTMADQLDITRSEIAAGYNDWRNNDPAAASAAFDKAIYSDGFTRLIREQQFATLVLAGTVAANSDKYEAAHALLVRASEYSQADSDVWQSRLAMAYAMKDYSDSALCVATIARRWPKTLDQINYASIYVIDRKLESDAAQASTQQALLESLFDAKWSTIEGEPSNLWHDLTAMLLAKNDMHKAVLVAARIHSARVALDMRVDKRFDRITRGNTQAFDIDRMAAEELASYKAHAQASPQQLLPLAQQEGLLLDTLQFEQVLAVSDEVIAKVQDGQGASSYKDFNDQYIWILDQRARALVRLGRWDEAAEQWSRASRRPEQGEMNVSQIVNLGEFYAEIGKTREAQEMVSELGDMSPLGRMQLEMVKLLIALQQKDQTAIAKHLEFMREHRADDIVAWENALLLTNDLDAAGDLLVERLHNEKWRTAALADMQHYADVRMTPVETKRLERWHAVLTQPKVQQTLAEVGRIERFNLGPAQN